MMKQRTEEPQFSRKSPPERAARMVETIFGCKWSLTVYNLLAHGINRPGEMVRSVEGLTKKVLNDCLRKNVEFGILVRKAYPEIPPRVEYGLTPFGKRFIRVLRDLEKLQGEIDDEARPAAARELCDAPDGRR
jgi:DNA-binding HxlR family transcriptional regulator